MNKYKKRYVENLLKHLIYKNTTILSSIHESRAALRDKKMPLWIEEPVHQIFDELAQDIGEALIPVMNIAIKEYVSRPDRLMVLKAIEISNKDNGVKKTCNCAACKENEDMLKVSK
jgi:hypothetical protein